MENYFGIYKKYWEQKVPEGATQVPTGHQGAPPPRRALVPHGAPGPLLAPIFWYIRAFDLKNYREDFRDGAPLSQGRTWVGALLLSGGEILPGILPSGG